MRRWLSAFGCSAALTCAAIIFPASAQDAPPPPQAYGRLPAVADAAISPDGTKVALAMSRDGASLVTVYDLDQRRAVYTTGIAEDSQLRGVGFADDQRVAFVMSRTFHPGSVLPSNMRFRGRPRRVDYYRTGVIDLATQKFRLLTTNDEDAWQDQGSVLIAPIEGDAGYGRLIGRAPGIETVRPAVYRVNLASGNSRMTATRGANADTLGYLLDERGAVVMRIDSDKETNRWRLFVYDGETPRLLLEDVSETGAPIHIVGLMADGRLAVLDEGEDGEFFRLYAMSRSNGAEKEKLFERERLEVEGTIDDPWTRRVVGVAWTEDVTKQHFFDAALQAAYERVNALFEAGSATLSSWSRDRRRILVYGEQALDGGGYYVFTPADNSLLRISMRYPEVAEAQRGARQAITYRARDGVRIPAYLTLPTVDEARNLPLVLLVHGGPRSRDDLEFDWWASFLASRGYAVLQPNFRGSSGYGRSWEHAGRRQWGGLMQTDVEDGVAALARAGMVDPARVCIVGASYGGYAALAGATLTPDRYHCAVSVAGVSDLVEMLRQDEARAGDDSMTADYWRLSIGDRQEDRERIRSVSPANLADRVRVPILLIHGTDDTVVPILQSHRMRDRLREAGKNVRFVELRGDDHYLSDAPTRIQMLREIETFLAEHIGARRQRAPAAGEGRATQ